MINNRTQRRLLKKENARQPSVLTRVPKSEWTTIEHVPASLADVFRSRDYLVQWHLEPDEIIRLSVCRTELNASSGRWNDKITWDELQKIKRQVGLGDRYAIEVYPGDLYIVNVANMRHLWVLPEPLPIGWRRP